jgi:hypothetical protein
MTANLKMFRFVDNQISVKGKRPGALRVSHVLTSVGTPIALSTAVFSSP